MFKEHISKEDSISFICINFSLLYILNSFRYVIKCDDDLLELAKKIESVEMTEILSLGQSLE